MVCARARARVRACVRVCLHACMHIYLFMTPMGLSDACRCEDLRIVVLRIFQTRGKYIWGGGGGEGDIRNHLRIFKAEITEIV